MQKLIIIFPFNIKYVAKYLIDRSADVNARDSRLNSGTPLHYAAKEGRTGCAKCLVEKDADIDAEDKYIMCKIFD